MAGSDNSITFLTYKYRLLPSKPQHVALLNILESQRILYNAALQERIDCYRKSGTTKTLYDQQKSLTEIRADFGEFREQPLRIQRWTLKRLNDAYAAYFRRLRGKGNAGFPRYRGRNRWRSFGFDEFCGIRIDGNRIYFNGAPGGIRIHLHRPLPIGKPLGCTFTRDHKGWCVCFQYRVPISVLPATGKQVGIDMGLNTLAILSTGEAIPNPRVAKRAERELRRRQRALSRCKRGSKRRQKVKSQVTRLHAKIANCRRTYLHRISARLVSEHDLIAVENLNVKGMASGMLAKSVNDAGWSTLKEMIAYKAEKAGRQMIEVSANGTSQTCPDCGQVKAKPLAQRVHECDCGCVLDRDHAAAIVIMQRAVMRPWRPNVTQWGERVAGNLACSGEALPEGGL